MSPDDEKLMHDALAARVADIRRNLEEQQRAFKEFSWRLVLASGGHTSAECQQTKIGGHAIAAGVALAGAVENFRGLDATFTELRAARLANDDGDAQ